MSIATRANSFLDSMGRIFIPFSGTTRLVYLFATDGFDLHGFLATSDFSTDSG